MNELRIHKTIHVSSNILYTTTLLHFILGEVGGYMGLLIGGSCLTILEVVDLFLYNCFVKVVNYRKVGPQPPNWSGKL